MKEKSYMCILIANTHTISHNNNSNNRTKRLAMETVRHNYTQIHTKPKHTYTGTHTHTIFSRHNKQISRIRFVEIGEVHEKRGGPRFSWSVGIGFHVYRFNLHHFQAVSPSRSQTTFKSNLSSSFPILFPFVFLNFILTIVVIIIIRIRIEKFPWVCFFFCCECRSRWLPFLIEREVWAMEDMRGWAFTMRNFFSFPSASLVGEHSGSINRIFVARSIKIYHLNFNSLFTHKIYTLLCFWFVFIFFQIYSTLLVCVCVSHWAPVMRPYVVEKSIRIKYFLLLFVFIYYRFFFYLFFFFCLSASLCGIFSMCFSFSSGGAYFLAPLHNIHIAIFSHWRVDFFRIHDHIINCKRLCMYVCMNVCVLCLSYLRFGTAVAACIGGGTVYGNGNFAATAGFSNNILIACWWLRFR